MNCIWFLFYPYKTVIRTRLQKVTASHQEIISFAKLKTVFQTLYVNYVCSFKKFTCAKLAGCCCRLIFKVKQFVHFLKHPAFELQSAIKMLCLKEFQQNNYCVLHQIRQHRMSWALTSERKQSTQERGTVCMWHRGLFKRLRKTKGHGAIRMKHCMIWWLEKAGICFFWSQTFQWGQCLA